MVIGLGFWGGAQEKIMRFEHVTMCITDKRYNNCKVGLLCETKKLLTIIWQGILCTDQDQSRS